MDATLDFSDVFSVLCHKFGNAFTDANFDDSFTDDFRFHSHSFDDRVKDATFNNSFSDENDFFTILFCNTFRQRFQNAFSDENFNDSVTYDFRFHSHSFDDGVKDAAVENSFAD
jgi:hypothetical protein